MCSRVFCAAFLFVTTAISLIACVKLEIEQHAVEFNEAVGSLSLRLLLLNGIRASKDYPLQFSAITTYQGTGAVTPSVQATIPIAGPASALTTISPKLDLKDPVSQLALADLNTQEAQAALRKPVGIETYRLFYELLGTRSLSVLNTVMLEQVTIDPALQALLKKNAEKKCSESTILASSESTILAPHEKQACLYRAELLNKCKHPAASKTIPLQKISIPSSVETECAFHILTMVGLEFILAGIDIEPIECKKGSRDTTGPQGHTSHTSQGALQKTVTNVSVTVNNDQKTQGGSSNKVYIVRFLRLDKTSEDTYKNIIGQHYKSKEVRALHSGKPSDKELDCQDLKKPGPVALAFRSPERMVRLIGEIIAVGNYTRERFVPEGIDLDTGARFALLKIEKRIPLPGEAAVSVRDSEGDTFFVPRPDYGSPKRDRSLEFLSIVLELVNSAISKKDLPQVPVFTLVGQ